MSDRNRVELDGRWLRQARGLRVRLTEPDAYPELAPSGSLSFHLIWRGEDDPDRGKPDDDGICAQAIDIDGEQFQSGRRDSVRDLARLLARAVGTRLADEEDKTQ